MGSYRPAQMLGTYGGIAGLIYIETDSLRQDAPFLYAVPLIALAVFTVNLKMKNVTKFFTAFSFLFAGAALYMVDRRVLEYTSTLMTLSHLLYLISFMKCMQRMWHGLAIVLTIYVGALLYYCFGDLFFSIPVLVILLAIHLCAIGASVLAAGSIWRYGSKLTSAEQADLLRFVGLLACLVCSSLLLLNRFGRRLQQPHYFIKLLCYLSQLLLFFANERAF